jgi:hypothetical protein
MCLWSRVRLTQEFLVSVCTRHGLNDTPSHIHYKTKGRFCEPSPVLITEAPVVFFRKRVGFLVVWIAYAIHDVALVRAELVTSCFNVPDVEKLILTTLTRKVVLHQTST